MTPEAASRLVERFLVAVTSMATSSGSLRTRLALNADHVLVFHPHDIPEAIRERYEEYRAIVTRGEVPPACENSPDYSKAVPAGHISPAKAKRAADLLASMLVPAAGPLAGDSARAPGASRT